MAKYIGNTFYWILTMKIHDPKGSEKYYETVVEDYLWTSNWSEIDNAELYNRLTEVIIPSIEGNFPDVDGDNSYGCKSSYYHGHYNLFAFPLIELSKVYYRLQALSKELIKEPGHYGIRAWPNAFAQGSNIGWHHHWPEKYNAYHGFYCVNVEGPRVGSNTQYKMEGDDEIIKIRSRNGTCVFGRSGKDEHISSLWQNEGYRITLAFDIVPYELLTHGVISFHDFIPLVHIK